MCDAFVHMRYFSPSILLALCLSVSAASSAHAAQLCLSDLPGWDVRADEAKTAARMALYKDRLGATAVRAALPWSLLEPAEGVWDDSTLSAYFKALRASGLRCKLIVAVVMDPPAWYLKKHPQLRMRDQYGATPRAIAPWARDQWPYLEQKTREIIARAKQAGIWDITDEVVIDLGPAGEPVYPPNWTMGESDGLNGGARQGEEGFFMYGESARADFANAMRAKYGDIAKANRAWGEHFKDWTDVAPPQPGTRTGKFWQDSLIWYRDAKRAFNAWRIESMLKMLSEDGRKRQGIVYLPGMDFSTQDWEGAVKTGGGITPVRLMIDNAFLIEQAARLGCLLQMTGGQEPAVCAHYVEIARKNGIAPDRIWLENAGEYANASNPRGMADLVRKYRLRGLDYTHTRWLFEDDRLTPKPPLFEELAKAWKPFAAKAAKN